MKKLFFFLLALLCSSITIFSQDCEVKTFYTNKVLLEPFIRDITGSGPELRNLTWGQWKDKEVIIHPTLKVKVPDELGCYKNLNISGPNETFTNILPGQLIELTLNFGSNDLTVSFMTCAENSLMSQTITLFMKQNDETINDYSSNYNYSKPDLIHTVTLDQPFQPPCEGAYNWAVNTCLQDYNEASTGSIKLYIKYGKGRNFLQKPIIFIEGLDLTNDVILDPETNEIVRIGSNGWENVVQGLVESKPVALENGTTDLELFRNYPKMLENLGESDINAFDIVLIDFHDGADYIQKNGELVIKAIQWINEMKQCGEENIVVGLSMGGQVARWALTKMENRGINHDTRTYISYDSPHLGANIPLAIQGFIWFNAYFGDAKTKSFIEKKWLDLNKPAAAQMLYTHFYKEWQSGKIDVEVVASKMLPLKPKNITPYHQINTDFDFHCLRESYLAEMNSLGYPKLTYNISIANGSGSGIPQTFAPGDCIITSDNINYPFTVPDVITIELYSSPGNNQNELLKVLVPNLSEQSLIFCKIVKTDLFDHPPYDAMPGCTRNDVAASIKPALDEAGIFEFPCVNDATCFMPTSSVIGYETDDFFGDLINDHQLKVNANLTPFDEIWLPTGGNEAHVDANIGNINFMEDQKDINLPDQPSQLPMDFEGGDIYNFGLYYKKMPSCEINDKGVMIINNEGSSSYPNANIPFKKNPTRKNLFEVTLAPVGCDEDEVEVNINEGGEMIIGSPTLRKQKRGILHVAKNTFLNNKQGKLTINDEGKIEIHKNGMMTLQNGSETYLEDFSEIVIYDGGKLIIEDGSMLRLKGNSRIVVKKGAELVIGQNAEIILDTPMSFGMIASHIPKNTGSAIMIEGELTIPDGKIKIGGKGFVWFLPEFKLSAPKKILLRGHGKDFTAFRFDTKMELNLDEFNVESAKCMVNKPFTVIGAYEIHINSSSFNSPLISSGSQVPTDNLLKLNNENKLIFLANENITILNSVFDDLPVDVTGFEKFISTNSDFSSAFKSVNINLKDGIKSAFTNCNIITNKPDFLALNIPANYLTKIGINCLDVFENRLNNSKINGFNVNNARTDDPLTGIDLLGIKQVNSPYLYINNSEIKSCRTGVFSPDGVNIIMDKSTIKDCVKGINMIGKSDLGMVKMLCSSLENNQIGINGQDILLAIDGIINSQTTKNGFVTANYFNNINSHFSICYKLKTPVSFEIPARLNRWVDSRKYSLGFCGRQPFMELIQRPESDGMCANVELSQCEDQAPVFPLTQAGIDQQLYTGLCTNVTCKGAPVLENYWKGFSCFYSDNLLETEVLFQPLAEEYFVDGNETLPLICKSVLREANTFVSGFNFFKHDSTVSHILEINPSCRKTGVNEFKTVLVLNIPEWAKPYRTINWHVSEGGVILEMSQDQLEITTNGRGKYLAIINGLQCRYRGYYNFSESFQFPYTCPPACLTSAPVLTLDENSCTLFIQNSTLEDVLQQTNATFTLQRFLNNQWVNITNLTSFQVTEDGTYRYVVNIEGCDDVYSNYIVTSCTNRCHCFSETLVYNAENCNLNWSNICDGFSVVLQRKNLNGTWVQLSGNPQSPFAIQIDGDYRLVFEKEGCLTRVSNTVSSRCALPGLCSCAAPTLSYNVTNCSVNWSQPSCSGFTTTLERQTGGVWSAVTQQSPYLIPDNSNGNYRLVTQKPGCFPSHSSVVQVGCSCTSPDRIVLMNSGILGTDLWVEPYFETMHMIPFVSNVCEGGRIEFLLSTSEVNANWSVQSENSEINVNWNYTSNMAKVYLFLPQPIQSGETTVTFTSPCGDSYTALFTYSCQHECGNIQIGFDGNHMESCENLNLFAQGGSLPYLWNIIGEGSLGTIINQNDSDLDLTSLLPGETIQLQVMVTDANDCSSIRNIVYTRCSSGCDGEECAVPPASCGVELGRSTGHNDNAIVNYIVEDGISQISILFNPLQKAQEYEISKNGTVLLYHSSIGYSNTVLICAGFNYNQVPNHQTFQANIGNLVRENNWAKFILDVNPGDLISVNISDPVNCVPSNWILIIECENEGHRTHNQDFSLEEILDEDDDFISSLNEINSNESQIKVSVSPNPTSSSAQLSVYSPNADLGEITIWNAVGQKVLTRVLNINTGFQTENIAELNDLPSGVYQLVLKTSLGSTTQRVIKID